MPTITITLMQLHLCNYICNKITFAKNCICNYNSYTFTIATIHAIAVIIPITIIDEEQNRSPTFTAAATSCETRHPEVGHRLFHSADKVSQTQPNDASNSSAGRSYHAGVYPNRSVKLGASFADLFRGGFVAGDGKRRTVATGDGSVNVFTAIVLSSVVIAAVGPGHYRSRGDRVARNLTTILLFRKITSYLICNALKTPWIDIRWIIGLDILDRREK